MEKFLRQVRHQLPAATHHLWRRGGNPRAWIILRLLSTEGSQPGGADAYDAVRLLVAGAALHPGTHRNGFGYRTDPVD